MRRRRRTAVAILALAVSTSSCGLALNGLEDIGAMAQGDPDAASADGGETSTGADGESKGDAGGAADTSALFDAEAGRDSATGSDASPPFCDPNDPTLLLCLRFENIVRDESSHATLPTSSTVTFTPGVRGEAARFVPPSSAIFFPNAAIWNVARVTVEAWLRPKSLPSGGARAGILDSDGRYGLFVYAPGTIDCLIQSLHLVGPVLGATQWTHVACVYDGATVTLYVGGIPSVSAPLSAAGSSAGTTAIGQNSPSGDPFDGDIDELRVFSAARTPAQIGAAAMP